MSDRTRSARRQQQDDEQDDSSINHHGGNFADVLAHRVANQVRVASQSVDFRDQRTELLDSFRTSGFELNPETVQDIVNGVADALDKRIGRLQSSSFRPITAKTWTSYMKS